MRDVPVHRLRISGGQRGVRQTIKIMNRLAIAGSEDPYLVQTAREVISYAPEGDDHAEMRAIEDYVRQHMRYTGDPLYSETLSDPRMVIRNIESTGEAYGDCDDFVTLIAAMALATGHVVRFSTRGQVAGRPDSHVLLKYMDRMTGTWTASDPIVRRSWDNQMRGYQVPGAANQHDHAPIGVGRKTMLSPFDPSFLQQVQRRQLLERRRRYVRKQVGKRTKSPEGFSDWDREDKKAWRKSEIRRRRQAVEAARHNWLLSLSRRKYQEAKRLQLAGVQGADQFQHMSTGWTGYATKFPLSLDLSVASYPVALSKVIKGQTSSAKWGITDLSGYASLGGSAESLSSGMLEDDEKEGFPWQDLVVTVLAGVILYYVTK